MSLDQPLLGFDAPFLQKLERLAVLNRRAVAGTGAGRRRSTRHGTSVELTDFRDYTPGDDIRHVDWNAYARLERLFLRLYSAEEVTKLTLLLDSSRSMDFGTPTKAVASAKLAAVFAYIALHNYDRVAVAEWDERLTLRSPSRSGKSSIPQVWRTISDTVSSTTPRASFEALKHPSGVFQGTGLAIVLSDFLMEGDWQGGLLSLAAAGQEVSVVQVLAREELEPLLGGDWELRDAESGTRIEVTLSSQLLQRYSDELQRHTDTLRDFCRRHQMVFAQIASDSAIDDLALKALPAVGLLG